MLSQKTRYALRALLHLAEAERGRPVPAAEIAEEQRVPRKFLEIILLELRKAGFVTSVTDGMIALVPCASPNFYASCDDCHDEASCAIRRAMIAVREMTVETLGRTTLASGASYELDEARLSGEKESVV